MVTGSRLGCVLGVILGLIGCMVEGLAAPVQSQTLANGMEVFVKPDHRAPVVVTMVWYRVGGLDEHRGETGISHLLEHMMFKGTEELEPGEFAEIIARHGGKQNAFTGQDYTAYFEQLAADRFEVALRLEADRMENLLLDPEEFHKERQVVLEERRLRVKDDPRALAHELLRSVAFDAHGYAYPVSGWSQDLQALTLSDLQDWYRRYYRPQNARLVVVGDVQPEAVFTLAKKHFGEIRDEGDPPSRTQAGGLAPRGQRQVDFQTAARVPYLVAGYRVPNLPAAEQPWEAYALRVLAGVLSEGDSARLTSHLVRQRSIATSANAFYDLESRASGLFYLEATPTPRTSLKGLQKVLYGEIEALRKELVRPDELARVKRQLVANETYSRDSVFFQAMQIGKLETIGYGHEYLDTYLDRIQAVTPEQIQAVARKYLQPQRSTLVRLHPQPSQSAEE